jgi:hypothetical protein
MGVTKRELQERFEEKIWQLQDVFDSLKQENEKIATSHIFKKLKIIYELEAMVKKYKKD